MPRSRWTFLAIARHLLMVTLGLGWSGPAWALDPLAHGRAG